MATKAIGIDASGIQISTDGGTTYAALGKTYKDSASLTMEEGEVIACESEEDFEPEMEIVAPGAMTLKFSTSDLDPAACQAAFGGTLSADKATWSAPENFEPKEVAVKFKTRSGLEVAIPRGKMSTLMNWEIKRNGFGLLDHTIKILKPSKGSRISVKKA